MQIHIDRNGQKFGPYSVEEAKGYLASGQLLSDDKACCDGLPNPVPLIQLLVTLQPAPAPAASPATPPVASTPENMPPVLSAPPQTGNIPVQISFSGEWMLVDSKVNLKLDGSPIGSFSFKKGFNLDSAVLPGSHQLTTEVKLGPIKRTKDFQFTCRGTESRLALTLDYCRISGNFSGLKVAEY